MPELIPILTTSERRAFKRCPTQWWWGYRQGLLPRDGETSTALWFGIGIHEALAALYQPGHKRNKSFIEVWENYCDNDELSLSVKADVAGEDVWVEARTLGIEMLRGYVARYDWDRNWDVIAVETPFELSIPEPMNPEKIIGVFTSTYDGVYRDSDDGLVKLMEHKTAKAISTAHLPMDDQGGSYWMSANFILRDRGILGAKESIDAITYNFLRKGLPDARPTDENGLALNKNGTISKIQPKPLFAREIVYRSPREQKKQLNRMANELLVMEQYRTGAIKPFKNPSNETCPFCPFRDMCQLEERGSDWKAFRDAVYYKQDPYIRYRKSAS